MITTGCLSCDEKQRETGLHGALCDKHRLQYLKQEALTTISHYLDEGLDGDDADYNFRKAKWRQRRARLAGLLNQIELDEMKEVEI